MLYSGKKVNKKQIWYSLRPQKKVMLWDFSDRLVEKKNIPNTSISHMISLKEGMLHGLLPN
jgi:hypothetical protein